MLKHRISTEVAILLKDSDVEIKAGPSLILELESISVCRSELFIYSVVSFHFLLSIFPLFVVIFPILNCLGSIYKHYM